MKILFVCMGNICRSPTAEGVFTKLLREHPSLNHVQVDSCGTIGYHAGEPPDPRSVKAAKQRGYDLSTLRARQITPEDLVSFDYILVMDKENYANTLALAQGQHSLTDKIKLFLSYSEKSKEKEVPDPYYGGESGFDHVIDLIEDASHGLIKELLQ